jgi:hypothetical protein
LDLFVAVVAGLVFAAALRVRWYVPIGDGLALAATAFVLYALAAAAIR